MQMNNANNFSIWNSMWMMTAFDVAIITLCFTTIAIILRERKTLRKLDIMWPGLMLIASMFLLAGFYLVDLYTMWILPAKVGMSEAMSQMRDLHLNVSWFKSLIMSLGIFIAMALGMRKLLQNSLRLESLNHTLDERLLELNKLSTAVNSSSSSIIISDRDGNIEYVNPGFSENYGFSESEIINQPINILLADDSEQNYTDNVFNAIGKDHTWRGTLKNKRKDGSTGWERVNVSVIENEHHQISHYISIHEDITHEHKITEKLNYQAKYDHLTGLTNRFEFEQILARLLQTAPHHTEHALCFMDLDQFKIVNDTCGHHAGDELLQLLSTVLQDATRKSDLLARLGGDEFALLMPHCSLDQAQRAITTLQEAVNNFQFIWEKQVFRLGISIGLVQISGNQNSLNEVMKNADTACYIAKNKGRNRLHIYSEEDSVQLKHEGEMHNIKRVYSAISNDEFLLYIQDILPLQQTDTTISYELLLRAKDRNGKIIEPDNFLPAAERFNIIGQLDRLVVTKAFEAISKNPEPFEPVNYLSINLSGQTIADENFLDFVLNEFQKSGVKPSKICFEITESTAISNLNAAKKLIHKLKGIGCHFALDDFGSGLSSFAYLKFLVVDCIKIDGLFVKDIASDPINFAMVKSINDIAHTMGLKTAAEFVESEEALNKLRQIGVDYVQGYAIKKPRPLDLFIKEANVKSLTTLTAH